MKLSGKTIKWLIISGLFLLFILICVRCTNADKIAIARVQYEKIKKEIFNRESTPDYAEMYSRLYKNKYDLYAYSYDNTEVLLDYLMALKYEKKTEGYTVGDKEFASNITISYNAIADAKKYIERHSLKIFNDEEYEIFSNDYNRILLLHSEYARYEKANATPVITTPVPHPDIPYVGMTEKLIDLTGLGKATKGKYEHVVIMNVLGETKAVSATTYLFYKSAGSPIIIFEAYVYDGTVVEVYDKRNINYDAYKYDSSKYDEYSDAEEYYYWNHDDLYDYEEAEDMYD